MAVDVHEEIYRLMSLNTEVSLLLNGKLGLKVERNREEDTTTLSAYDLETGDRVWDKTEPNSIDLLAEFEKRANMIILINSVEKVFDVTLE